MLVALWAGVFYKRMTTDLVSMGVMKAYNLRQPIQGWFFHGDRASQYTSKRYRD